MAEATVAMNEQVAEAVVAGKLDEAKLLAERMKATHGVAPDATTLHILVDAFVRAHRVADAQACLEQFTTMHGIAPAIESLQAIAAELVRSGPPEAAAVAISSMREKFAFAPDAELLKEVATKLLKGRKPVLAADLLLKCGPNTVDDIELFQSVVAELLNARKPLKAKEILIRCPAKPSERMVSSTVSSLSAMGKLDEAAQLAAQMWAKFRSAAERQTLNRLVQAYLAKEKYDHATRLVKGMKQFYGVQPEAYACNLIIHSLVKSRRLNEAQSVLDAMVPEIGVNPTCITLSSVIAGYAKGGQLDKAKAMIQSMESVWGVKPELVTHNSIVSALCREGRLDEAVAYTQSIKVPLGVRTFGPLLRAAIRTNDIHRVREYWSMMVRERVQPDTFLWNGMLSMEASHGTEETFEETYDQMKRSGIPVNDLTMRTVDSARERFRRQRRTEPPPTHSHSSREADYRGSRYAPASSSHSYERRDRGYESHSSDSYLLEHWREDGQRPRYDERSRSSSHDYPARDEHQTAATHSYQRPRYPSDAHAAAPPSHYAAERPAEDYATRYPPARDTRAEQPPRKPRREHRTPLYGDAPSARYEPYPSSSRKEKDSSFYRQRAYN